MMAKILLFLFFLCRCAEACQQIATTEYVKDRLESWKESSANAFCKELFESAKYKSVSFTGATCAGAEVGKYIISRWFCYTRCIKEEPVPGVQLSKVHCTGSDSNQPNRAMLQCQCHFDESAESKKKKEDELNAFLAECKEAEPVTKKKVLFRYKGGRRIAYEATATKGNGYQQSTMEQLKSLNGHSLQYYNHRDRFTRSHWQERPNFVKNCKASAQRSFDTKTNATSELNLPPYALTSIVDAWEVACRAGGPVLSTTTTTTTTTTTAPAKTDQPPASSTAGAAQLVKAARCDSNEVYNTKDGSPECDKYCGVNGISESCTAQSSAGCLCANDYRREKYNGTCVLASECPKFTLKCGATASKNNYKCTWPAITGVENYAFIIYDDFLGARFYLLPYRTREIHFDVGQAQDNFTIVLKCLKKELFSQKHLEIIPAGRSYTYKLSVPVARLFNRPGADVAINKLVPFYNWNVVNEVKAPNGTLVSVNSDKAHSFVLTPAGKIDDHIDFAPDGQVLQSAAKLTFNTAGFIKESNSCPNADGGADRSCRSGEVCTYGLDKESAPASCQTDKGAKVALIK